jgi:hypothetical protein
LYEMCALPPLRECNMLPVDADGDLTRFKFRVGCSAMNYELDACMNGCMCCVSNCIGVLIVDNMNIL